MKSAHISPCFFSRGCALTLGMGLLKKRCKTYGCPNLHHNKSGYCDECETKWRAKHPRKDDRPSAAARGYDARWAKFARDFLQRHPVCAMCGAPATCVDHRDMTADMMMDAWGAFDLDPSHYQALCNRCNASKGAREDKAMREAYLRDRQELDAMAEDPRGGVGKTGTPSRPRPVGTLPHTEGF